jgi:hypothetical protein
MADEHKNEKPMGGTSRNKKKPVSLSGRVGSWSVYYDGSCKVACTSDYNHAVSKFNEYMGC